MYTFIIYMYQDKRSYIQDLHVRMFLCFFGLHKSPGCIVRIVRIVPALVLVQGQFCTGPAAGWEVRGDSSIALTG